MSTELLSTFADVAAQLRNIHKNNYEKLGLPTPARPQNNGHVVHDDEEEAHLDESIRVAIKRLALIVHPDKVDENLKNEATDVFRILQKIREEMTSTRSRDCYDSRLFDLRTRRFLILMDMGGSLLCKTTRQIPNFDFQMKMNRFFVRPHCAKFLKSVLDPNFGIDFAIYTSRQAFNAEPQIQLLGKAVGIPNLQSHLFALYAGDAFSNEDPHERHPDGVPKTIRSLPKIWMHRTCTRPGIMYDECNTINIDSDARKLQDHPENGIIVPAYEEKDVLSRQGNDRVLLNLLDYLTQLQNWAGDIRDYIKMYPFYPEGGQRLRVTMKLEELEDNSKGPRGGARKTNNNSSREIDSLTERMRRM